MPEFDLKNSGHALEKNLLAMEMEVCLTAVESLEFGPSMIVLVLSTLFCLRYLFDSYLNQFREIPEYHCW
jgi:hypothetical protein